MLRPMKSADASTRLKILTELLESGALSTQEELVQELSRQNFQVTQSTISRDLRRIGAIKTLDANGQTVYRLPDESIGLPVRSATLEGLVLDIAHNGATIVIHTTPGSASLVARHLDSVPEYGVLGTIAGDDTIFVAPSTVREIEKVAQKIRRSLS